MSTREPSVLQVAAWYPPFNLGGTEVYLEGLVRELGSLGVKSTVLVPRPQNADDTYVHAGTQVTTYRVNETPVPAEMKDGKPHLDFDQFRAHLLKHRTAIYHQHSWTRGCGAHHLRAARDLGFRTVLTVHVPGNICLRGTMLRFGEGPCDGRVEETGCGACWAQSRGSPKLAAQAIANLPLSVAKRSRRGKGRLATALSARALAAEKSQHIAEMIANSDRIVAVCQWLHAALVANGVPAHKLLLSRQGVSRDYLDAAREAAGTRSKRDAPLQLLFLGRWDPAKGVDVVVRAVRFLPGDMAVNLTIRAIPALLGERAYEDSVRVLASVDPRISIEPPVARSDLAATLSNYDALVVPSLCMETGPLVVLEAQAAGLFVLGAGLGGIAELVDEGDAGELVPAGNVGAWAEAIERLASRHRHGNLTQASRPLRTIAIVAAEMADLYRSL
jgi:glycosyltransferase involved in cell wall biosynthesis